jgi:DNA-binding transcriptional LysR family regulator
MIFAFVEEIHGPSWRARNPGPRGAGSFSAVAREREPSQAAVARRSRSWRNNFGGRLFHRTTRKLSLNDDGQMLLGLARPILDAVKDMEAAAVRQSA